MINSDAKMNFCARHFKYCDVSISFYFLFAICPINSGKKIKLKIIFEEAETGRFGQERRAIRERNQR